MIFLTKNFPKKKNLIKTDPKIGKNFPKIPKFPPKKLKKKTH